MDLSTAVKRALDGRRDVVAAYVFGSVARGLAHDGSDVDVGLLLEEGVRISPYELSRIALEIESNVGSGREADVHAINNSSLRFIAQVLRDGRPVYVRDERKRIQFESAALLRYLDFKPHILLYDAYVQKRMAA